SFRVDSSSLQLFKHRLSPSDLLTSQPGCHHEGDKDTLNKDELKELLQNEFGDLLCKANDQTAVDRIFKDLDTNQSNSVDFSEFVNLVSCLTQMCHEHFIGKK
ncbi:hypothetical protein CHARACLAT_019544, partial [Characodon lateralis]|nr:hypothetical protein [Characodon lateralis]